MNSTIAGIHHITAIASDPQRNIDFYAGTLGLRLVKKTVNFDDPAAYHLYYGDATGTPGTIVTFFYWPDGAGRGRVGPSQVTRLSFSAPAESLNFWTSRLESRGVKTRALTRFGEDTLAFHDPDGIPVEIVAVAGDGRTGWDQSEVPAAYALRGFRTAELTFVRTEDTERLLREEMGYRLVRREDNRSRFEIGRGGSGTFIDVIADPKTRPGLGGIGTIHHVAWSVPDDTAELEMRDRLTASGFNVSPVRDRTYFHSIYYRERGGILFEIARAVPGFASDESVAALGTALMLPTQFEPHRAEIEKLLPELAPARAENVAASLV
jgi:glyoxalase family protein